MTTPIDPIAAVQGALAAPAATAPPSVNSEAATQRFASLMSPADAPVRPSPAVHDGPNAITEAISTQEDSIRQTFDDSRYMARHGHEYELADVVAFSEHNMKQLSMATLSLGMIQAAAQSTNKGLTTLLKNQ